MGSDDVIGRVKVKDGTLLFCQVEVKQLLNYLWPCSFSLSPIKVNVDCRHVSMFSKHGDPPCGPKETV